MERSRHQVLLFAVVGIAIVVTIVDVTFIVGFKQVLVDGGTGAASHRSPRA